MSNLYLAEYPIDDTSLAANEFLHADVVQAIANNSIRVYRSRMQPIIHFAAQAHEDMYSSAATDTIVCRATKEISSWATKVHVDVALWDDGDPTARFRFRVRAGDDGASKSVVMPDADGDWVGSYFQGYKVLDLQTIKGNYFDTIELEFIVYCKNSCGVLRLDAWEDHT